MSAAYTPGPWIESRVGEHSFEIHQRGISGDPVGFTIAAVNAQGKAHKMRAAETARLIAAAPALADALRALVLADRLNVSEWSAAAKRADEALRAAGVTP